MSTPFKIVLFTVAVTGFYTYVGAIVPQMEAHPPESVEIGEGLSPAELAAAGRKLFFGKGTCALCHTIGEKGQRCPDLAGVGARAGGRVPDLDAVEYLAASLYEPNAYIVDGYTPTMPRIDRPPIGLGASEIVAVIAFLQSLGGEITVTPGATFSVAGASAPEPSSASAAPESSGAGDIIERYGCGACHRFDGPERLLGPSLYDLGARLDRPGILQAIVEPDATIAEGSPPYPAGLMAATLGANGFYKDLSLAQLTALVDHLAALQGEAQ